MFRDTLLAMNKLPTPMDRRTFLAGAAVTAAALSSPRFSSAQPSDLEPIWKEIEKRHDESVRRLQTWIRQPSIAAENREVNEGCELTMQMLRDAGFQSVTKAPSDGQPGIFATLDAGAPRTLGVYFMYDVKQVTPSEWSSPPWDAALVDKPGLGKVVVGRGAVNQKGPEATFLAALHAEDFHRDRDWRLAAALPLQGLRRGDGVALVPDDDTASRCSWAYLSGLHIVAEYGAIPWRIAPNDRLWLDGDPGEPADGNPAEVFWGLPEERRSAILRGFERVGARAVVSLSRPNDTDGGWVPVADTGAWLYSFPTGMSVASRR